MSDPIGPPCDYCGEPTQPGYRYDGVKVSWLCDDECGFWMMLESWYDEGKKPKPEPVPRIPFSWDDLPAITPPAPRAEVTCARPAQTDDELYADSIEITGVHRERWPSLLASLGPLIAEVCQ